MATMYIDPETKPKMEADEYPILKQQKVTYLGAADQGKLIFDGDAKLCIKCKCNYVFKSRKPFPHQCHFYRWRVVGSYLEITPTARIARVILWLEFGRRISSAKMRKKWRKDGGYYLPSWLSATGKTEFIKCEVGEVIPPSES